MSNADVASRVASEYRGERQANREVVEGHIMALETSGLVESSPLSLGSDDVLVRALRVTEYGRARM